MEGEQLGCFHFLPYLQSNLVTVLPVLIKLCSTITFLYLLLEYVTSQQKFKHIIVKKIKK